MIKTKSGFTIVELLIVIVVIGILAAITIVAYNGIQQRGRNAQTVAAVNAYLKGLAQYAVINSSYPPITNSPYICLGENNPGDLCWRRLGTPGAADAMAENSAFNTALKTFMGTSLPDANPTIVSGNNGIMFVYHTHSGVTLDGQQYPYYIMYIMEGAGTKCPVGQLLSGVWATFTSTTPSAGYTVALAAGTECWIKLPNPSSS